MPSTPESLLRAELQATGENATTWGIKTNNNIELLAEAIAGVANINVGGSGNYTLVASNYVSDEARPATLVLTGTLSGNRDVIVPSSPKHYTIINQTSGAFPLTIRQVSGTGVAIPTGSSQIVCTSTTCVGVGINDVSRAGDTMTGALGFVVGTSALPGVFPAGDTNTGFFQAAAAPDTLSISVGGTEVARYGTGGFMRLAAGTAAAPSYSFEPDTDTGFYREGANSIGVAAGGKQIGAFQANSWFMLGDSALNQSIFYLYNGGASASQQRLLDITSTNEGFQPIVTLRANINTDGSGNLEVFATPAGSRASDRRVNRMTIPGSGPINLAGDVDVSGNLRFNSGYGSAALAYGVRAWANFNGTGTVAIRGSGGVTSITDNGTGDYTVNFNFTLPDTNYAVLFGGTSANGRFTRVKETSSGDSNPVSKTTTAVRIFHAAATSDPADCADVNLAIVR